MITKMSRYIFMVYHKEYDGFLQKVRDLGLVHIQNKQSIEEYEELKLRLEQRKEIGSTLMLFKGLNKQNEAVPELKNKHSVSIDEGLKLLDRVGEIQEELLRLENLKRSLQKEIDDMSVWGSFSYDNIRKAEESGYKITFFATPAVRFNQSWIEEYNAVIINEHQSLFYFLTLTKGEIPMIDADKPKLSSRELACLEADMVDLNNQIKAKHDELNLMAKDNYADLLQLDEKLQDVFNYSNAKVQTVKEADNMLMVLEGWIPTEKKNILEQTMEEDNIFYRELAIEDVDEVPIQLKNNKFARLYEPITRLFALPRYTEFDPTPLFAPFFMMFFGFCFGDGGYGIVIMLIAGLLKKKANEHIRPFLSLFQYLGLATLVFGILTGSFFGISIGELAVFEPYKNYFLNSDNLMSLSLIIGIVQILFGKTVAALNTAQVRGWKYGIAPFAWVVTILSGFLVFGLPMVGIPISGGLQTVLYALVGLGLVLALFYNSPGKNIFVNFGTGLWNTYNTASGLLGDTLSYIRLFAIGLTSSILGGVFNTLAIDLTDGMSIMPRIIVAFLILAFGHTMNFGLAMISSLVHPLRLIFVEYFKNSEYTGGGIAYDPFKKISSDK